MPEANDEKDETSPKLDDRSVVESKTDNKSSEVKEEEGAEMKETMPPSEEKVNVTVDTTEKMEGAAESKAPSSLNDMDNQESLEEANAEATATTVLKTEDEEEESKVDFEALSPTKKEPVKEEIPVKETPVRSSTRIRTRKARASLGSSSVDTAVDITTSQPSTPVRSTRRKTRSLGSSADDLATPQTSLVRDRRASRMPKIKEENAETSTPPRPVRKSARKSVASKRKSAGADVSAKKRRKRG